MSDILPTPIAPREYDLKRVMIQNEEVLAEAIDHTFYHLVRQREPYDASWREAMRLVLPERSVLLDWYEQSGASQGVQGAQDYIRSIGADIADATGVVNLQILAAGIQGHVVTETDSWFTLTLTDPRAIELPGVRQWLRELTILLYDALGRSNFYSELAPMCLDAGATGTATQWFVYDDGQQKPYFKTCHPMQVYLQQNSRDVVDTVYRTFQLTRRQAIQKFGERDLSPHILDSENPTETFLFLHVVCPRTDFAGNMGLRPRSMEGTLIANAPYVSLYKEVVQPTTGYGLGQGGATNTGASEDYKRILSIGGFREFPYAAWRWDTDSVSPYGISPTMRALPIVRLLQYMGENLMASAQHHVRPSVNVPSDMQGAPQLFPGGVNYFEDAMRKVEVIPGVAGDYPIGVDREDNLRNQQRELFSTDYFLTLSRLEEAKRQKTATEVNELQAEKSVVMPSLRRRMAPDFLNRVIIWTHHQEKRRGRLPAPPESLRQYANRRGGRIRIDYTGPLSLAQRRLGTIQGHMRLVQSSIPLLEMYPQGVDILELDEMLRGYYTEGGVPDNWIRSKQQVATLRQIAAQRIEEENARENLKTGAQAIRNVQTPGGGGPAQ